MKLFYVETEVYCCLQLARTAESARRKVLKETSPYYCTARLATKQDIAWVKAMGGLVPE